MPHVPGLRSPYAKVGRLVHFGRMLDKIRLHARGALPTEYQRNLGDTSPNFFDGRCCRFLGIAYPALVARTLAGGTDAEILDWAHAHGTPRSDEECDVWNSFMMKRGWRDAGTATLQQRIRESHLEGGPIATMFDFLDFDEGRDPVARRAWELRPGRIVLVMGVAGSGKTTIGQALAETLGWRFADADAFHPPANIAKMSAGEPLNDADRAPWLDAIRAYIDECLRNDESAVVTCSALKRDYRHRVRSDPARVHVVYLKGTRELLAERLGSRQGHFMKPAMLDSQLAALEEPADALVCDIAPSPAEIIARIRRELGLE